MSWDVRESEVAGTDGAVEQSWSHRLALQSLSPAGDSTKGLCCGEGTSLQMEKEFPLAKGKGNIFPSLLLQTIPGP